MTEETCSHNFKRIGLRKEPVVEETDYAVVEWAETYQVNRCILCGYIEKVFLWGGKRQVTWKDNILKEIAEADEERGDGYGFMDPDL